MSKISEAFNGHKAFIPFVVANYPDRETTVKNVVALAQAGADIVELGIPFSDPLADGPVIQAADVQVLGQGELKMDDLFDLVKEIRQQTDVPLAFLTYLNIVFRYGYDQFAHRCQQVGVNGLIIPDLPLEEQGELRPFTTKYGIDLIPLVTPTSGDRVEKIAKQASGFIYVVSSLGVTGERDQFDKHLRQLITQIRAVTKTPTAIGFGVHTPEQASQMSQVADGVIIGSACVKLIHESGAQAPEELGRYAQQITAAIR